MDAGEGASNVLKLRLRLVLHMHGSMLADTGGTESNQTIFYDNPGGTVRAEVVDGLVGMGLAVYFGKIDHGRIIADYILGYFHPRMQKTSSQAKLHQKNITLHRVTPSSGAIGQKHSRLIDQLAAEVQTRTKELQALTQASQPLSQKEKELLKRIEAYDRQQGTLKREMMRISEMAKAYKNSKIQIELKNQSLLQECSRSMKEAEEMKMKVELLTQFNAMLIKIAENSLQVLPRYSNNFEEIFQSIEKVKTDLGDNTSGTMAVCQLRRKLQSFKLQMENIQSFNRKLTAGLAEVQQETKSISQRMSILSQLNFDDLLTHRNGLSHPNQNPTLEESCSSGFELDHPSSSSEMGLYSRLLDVTIIPVQPSRMNKILQQICLLFQQHIHLLQTQKMQYQFTKNKKLITAQKYECEICESYEKIVSQIFSIVREAFKEIKFQFLREIKQVDDISEIPFLI